MRALVLALSLCVGCARRASPPEPSRAASAPALVAPSAPPFEPAAPAIPRLRRVDDAVEAALARGDAPGAVVLVRRAGETLHERAYGRVSERPWPAPMPVDAIFDLASLTKPLATALSVMVLVEDGKLALTDRVDAHLPEARGREVGAATVEQLLTHTSGLPADDAMKPGDELDPVAAVLRARLVARPGERFVYSDLGFVLLAKLIERRAERPLPNVLRRVTSPMGLRDLGFVPDAAQRARAAPTTLVDGAWRRGEVHDPRAARQGGVAGHAGLFGTARDVAAVAEMLLAGGVYRGTRVLREASVRELLRPRPVSPGGLRALGWDVDTGYTHQRGKRFGRGFGHTGFTGTSVWVDPETATVIVVLTSRLHPDGKGDVRRLRAEIADAVAETVLAPTAEAGVDALLAADLAPVRGLRVALLTHDAARTKEGVTTREALARSGEITLVRLFAPEHGLSGAAEGKRADARDGATGLPVISLYGDKRAPSDADLADVDALLVDLVDVGARSFTYASTLADAMVAARRAHKRVVVLDRPNPLGGAVEGPLLDDDRRSFVAPARVPSRHGLTLGELGGLLGDERGVPRPEVVRARGWRRADGYWKTRLPWHRPSPNLTSAASALLYPGVALLENTNVSVGRGTDAPFLVVGAPWVDGARLARALAAQGHPGVGFEPALFTPRAATFAGHACGGVRVRVDDPAAVRPVRVGLGIALALSELAPSTFEPKGVAVLLGSQRVQALLQRRAPWSELVGALAADERAFEASRAPYLLYQ
ncbi:MAG: DUF1343 domain-containing protein [Polyangiaceae bacterium]|nr:DUF1343 domain-containing protein [Polyangiaceae bacterium]